MVHVIGFRDTVIGFRLLGINGTILDDNLSADSLNQVKTLINEFQKRKEPSIIFINEKIMEPIEEFIIEIKKNHDKVIIIDIPDRRGTIKPIIDLNFIIQKVVGMKI